MKTLLSFAFILICTASNCQSSEMSKFYHYYKIPEKLRKACDSVYQLIEHRRAAFSKEFRAYKEKNSTTEGFKFNWSEFENEIVPSLKKQLPKPLKHLIYYSYFDLGYGIYGLMLNTGISQKALKEIEPSSAIWAMEPSLLEAVIKQAEGDDKNAAYINNVIKLNKDANLVKYVRNNLSQARALKTGKQLPVFQYKDLSDSSVVFSTKDLRNKYYLIDVWATWCKPCIEEFPVLLKEYDAAKKHNVEFISISIDDNAQTAVRFLNGKFDFPWPEGIANRKEVMEALMITGIPCTIFIDPKGKILSYGSELRGANLQKTINQLVEKK